MPRTRATPPAPLSREALIDAALAIADAEGLDALSMRRIGSELGVAAMSLYNHVASKDELLALVVDHVFGTVPDVDRQADWASAVVGFFVALHAALLAHPAAAQVATLHEIHGPHIDRHGREVLAALRRGLPDAQAREAFTALSCYTLGAALYTTARAGAGRDRFRSGAEHLVRGYAG